MVFISFSITISRRPSASIHTKVKKSQTTSSSSPTHQHQNQHLSFQKEDFIPPSPHRSSLSKHHINTTTTKPKPRVITKPNPQGGITILPPRYSFTTSNPSVQRIVESLEDFLDDQEIVSVERDERREKMGTSEKGIMVDANHKDVVTSMDPDRRKSYGIGGAGNIRRPSEIIYPQRLNSDGTPRRSSIWSVGGSSSNPDGKTRWSWFGLRNGNSVSTSRNDVKFREVNLGGEGKE